MKRYRLRWPFQWIEVTEYEWRRSLYGRFVWYYATKTGGPVLKGEAHWWQVNGFLFQAKGKNVGIVFRRHIK